MAWPAIAMIVGSIMSAAASAAAARQGSIPKGGISGMQQQQPKPPFSLLGNSPYGQSKETQNPMPLPLSQAVSGGNAPQSLLGNRPQPELQKDDLLGGMNSVARYFNSPYIPSNYIGQYMR